MQAIELAQSIQKTRQEISQAIASIRTKIDIGEKTEIERNKLLPRLTATSERIKDITSLTDHMVKMYKVILNNQNKRSKIQLQNIQKAIRLAGRMVPDSDLDGAELVIPEGKNQAYIGNKMKRDVARREGGAVRGIISALIKYAGINALDDSIRVIAFDESFFACSDITIANLRKFLVEMSKDCLVIAVDQRGHVIGNIASKTFYVSKNDGYSRILSEEEQKRTYVDLETELPVYEEVL